MVKNKTTIAWTFSLVGLLILLGSQFFIKDESFQIAGIAIGAVLVCISAFLRYQSSG